MDKKAFDNAIILSGRSLDADNHDLKLFIEKHHRAMPYFELVNYYSYLIRKACDNS